MFNNDDLKQDLVQLDSRIFFLKYIIKTHNWYFLKYLKTPSDELTDKMDLFKETVSRMLGVSFHSVQMVGSAKVGFSLSPKKLLKPFHDETLSENSSDIDIAIISEKYYIEYWNNLRKIREVSYHKYYYSKIAISIFRGYIDDKKLLKIDSLRKKWQEVILPINKALQDKLNFSHPINYRIYRSWEDLEDYQVLGIRIAQNKLIGGENV